MFQLGQNSPIAEKARISPRSFFLIWLRRGHSGCRLAISAFCLFYYLYLFYCLLILEHWVHLSSNLPQTVELKCLLPAKLKRPTNPWAFGARLDAGPLATPPALLRHAPLRVRQCRVRTPVSQSGFCPVPCKQNNDFHLFLFFVFLKTHRALSRSIFFCGGGQLGD